MTDAALISSSELHFAMDYGTFSIIGQQETWELIGDLGNSKLLDRALEDSPSASNDVAVLIISPHQYNFHMTVTIEHWSTQPPDDSSEWEQVSQERLTVDAEEVMVFGSPTSDEVIHNTPTGTYWLDISGRGFTAAGSTESLEPGDVWRVRVWSASGHLPNRTTKLWRT